MGFTTQVVNPYTNRKAGITETRGVLQLSMAKSQDILSQIVTGVTKPPGEEAIPLLILPVVIIAKESPE